MLFTEKTAAEKCAAFREELATGRLLHMMSKLTLTMTRGPAR